MSLRTLVLAAVGGTLTATSLGSCYVLILAEPETPPVLGSPGTRCFLDRGTLGWVPLATSFVGGAFTIGAMMLLAWAIGVDSNGR